MLGATSAAGRLPLDVDKRAALSHGAPRIRSSSSLLVALQGGIFLACRWRLDAGRADVARAPGLLDRPSLPLHMAHGTPDTDGNRQATLQRRCSDPFHLSSSYMCGSTIQKPLRLHVW